MYLKAPSHPVIFSKWSERPRSKVLTTALVFAFSNFLKKTGFTFLRKTILHFSDKCKITKRSLLQTTLHQYPRCSPTWWWTQPDSEATPPALQWQLQRFDKAPWLLLHSFPDTGGRVRPQLTPHISPGDSGEVKTSRISSVNRLQSLLA